MCEKPHFSGLVWGGDAVKSIAFWAKQFWPEAEDIAPEQCAGGTNLDCTNAKDAGCRVLIKKNIVQDDVL
jgi:hypothetical protein